MRTETYYVCEICERSFEIEANALACEKGGIANPSIYPIGLMYEHHHNGFVGVFSIAEVEKENRSHFVSLSSWAVRVNPYPRYTLGNDKCGGTHNFLATDKRSFSKWIERHFVTKERVGSREFEEMVSFLKSQGITPKYYDEDQNLITIN